MIKLYGIPNCDTVKKARTWLTDHNIEFEFHDFKKQGLNETIVNNWLQQSDWEILVNRKGTTWRGLPDDVKASVTNDATAMQVMLANASVIKRPVLEQNGKLLQVGFNADSYSSITF